MEELLQPLEVFNELSLESLKAVVDILLVSFVIYKLLSLIRGTRAWRIVGGVFVFVLALVISASMGMRTLHWLMDKATILGPVALVILLLPELRQALEGFGKIGLWPQKLTGDEEHAEAHTVEELIAATAELSASRTGAIIVIERTTPLNDIVGNGVQLDSKVSAPLLCSIFFGTNPLHDGAVIIRADRAIAAACRLPLSDNMKLDPSLHMRHRAAAGVTEQFDCIAIVVSEERGTISFVVDGILERLSHQDLRDRLNRELRGIEAHPEVKVRRLRSHRPKREEEEAPVETRVS